ncbi:hypothetical protein [Hyalangium versicolor]|uniref:hypothetical protein n=1 Tax=Hyalangium versicolor TaxID=2861190 RepID=UPI001CCBC2AB|nr:hypothetical protein [Hyalangium versicolor]
MQVFRVIVGVLVLCLHGCSHANGHTSSGAGQEEGIRTKGGTASARIWALIAQGQFAEAQVLISEGTAGGLVSKELASRMLQRISVLTTKLGEIPARLQRVRDFPSQLKDFTLFEIKTMLDKRDFSTASQAQLQMARKLIEEEARLMEK